MLPWLVDLANTGINLEPSLTFACHFKVLFNLYYFSNLSYLHQRGYFLPWY